MKFKPNSNRKNKTPEKTGVSKLILWSRRDSGLHPPKHLILLASIARVVDSQKITNHHFPHNINISYIWFKPDSNRYDHKAIPLEEVS